MNYRTIALKVLRQLDRISIKVGLGCTLLLLGSGLTAVYAAHPAKASPTIYEIAVCIGLAAVIGAAAGVTAHAMGTYSGEPTVESKRFLRNIVTGAGSFATLAALFAALGSVYVTDTWRQPVPSVAITTGLAATALGLIAEILGFIIRHLPVKENLKDPGAEQMIWAPMRSGMSPSNPEDHPREH